MKKFPFYFQLDEMDCGPSCVRMIAKYYGKEYPLRFLRENSFILKTGVSLLGISQLADKIGMESRSMILSTEDLCFSNSFPCILHWNQNHFVVLTKITTSYIKKEKIFHIADPAHGKIKLTKRKFQKSWLLDSNNGVALFLKPTPTFYKIKPPKKDKLTIKYILSYLLPFKKKLSILFILLLLGSLLTLILPFLTEALIDKGVNDKNLNFIFIILLAQLSVFIGSITIEIIRNWLMLQIGTLLSINIISGFLKKLLQLPIKFFDTKVIGDLNQRIDDNDRLERFLTSQSLTTFFSIITFSVFFVVLWYYNLNILLVYLTLTALSISWTFYWLKERRVLDYLSFKQRSDNQESIYEILNGVTEMKLNQFEESKRLEWERIQHKLYKLNLRVLKVDQIQLSGFNFLNQVKNILVTFLAAYLVVKNEMTLGALLSISYIIGQMNSPVNQLVNFFRSLQDAKLSLERLNEVQNHPEEEKKDHQELDLHTEGKNKGIRISKLSFQYEGPKSPSVLKDIDMLIPEGKITAIVGASGSGKTTLMKILLKFYEPTEGEIFFNHLNSKKISPKSIRENTGIVMQNGYIFSDSIKRNIITGSKNINKERLIESVKISNSLDFINSLPLKFETKIGESGIGLSGGQRQRILIARAVYKNPHYIFLDEATSALDAGNEKIIHDNLNLFFEGKTVLIIAHRLSTVKNADQIIVLKEGRIVERGNHDELVKNKNYYYNLVKNQLELGN